MGKYVMRMPQVGRQKETKERVTTNMKERVVTNVLMGPRSS